MPANNLSLVSRRRRPFGYTFEPMPIESRLIELETRYAHLERQVADLSEVVFEQRKELDALGAQLRAVNARLEQQGDATPNDPPPHY